MRRFASKLVHVSGTIFFPHPQRNIGLKSRPAVTRSGSERGLIHDRFNNFVWECPTKSSDFMIKMSMSPNYPCALPDHSANSILNSVQRLVKKVSERDEMACYGRHSVRRCEESIGWIFHELVHITYLYFQEIMYFFKLFRAWKSSAQPWDSASFFGILPWVHFVAPKVNGRRCLEDSGPPYKCNMEMCLCCY